MNRYLFTVAFALGLLALLWVGAGFVGTSAMALIMTVAMAGVYGLGAWELARFRGATRALGQALAQVPQPLEGLDAWLAGVPHALQHTVRLRIEGERTGLPGPALTPYLVGLLVMLGMLGTFLGMVVTFKGAVFALEGSADLQAIRSALAAPIKGLGLAFGTSVAGVAASAMLGLMSALARRERAEAGRALDARVATDFRPFSLVHQRQETFKALQAQSQALPRVVDGLQALVEGLEHRSQQLSAQLLDQQARFHLDAAQAYTGLAESVGQALHTSLASSAQAAGDSLQRTVQAAMAEMVQASAQAHQRQMDATQAQLAAVANQFGATAQAVSSAWAEAEKAQAKTHQAWVDGLGRTLTDFTQTFEQRSATLLSTVQDTLARAQADWAGADRQRLDAWAQAQATVAETLQREWQHAGAQTLARQDAVCQTLAQTATAITERSREQAEHTLGGLNRLLAQSQALAQARSEADARGEQQHAERLAQLTTLWRTELAALRQDEALRGQAAVDRLAELQTALTQHLATLGNALEAPMARMVATASEVPQAAAGVIAQLREEMSRLAERDNLALAERAELVGQIHALLQGMGQAAAEQRAAIQTLVASAQAGLDDAHTRFAQALGAQADQTARVAAHVSASAVELASVGEAFGHGMALFNTTHEKLTQGLMELDTSLQKAMARSDEQLAYCVAQAREVIDLSIAAQQGIVEDLRRLGAESRAGARVVGRSTAPSITGDGAA